jgi:hypothetical protein
MPRTCKYRFSALNIGQLEIRGRVNCGVAIVARVLLDNWISLADAARHGAHAKRYPENVAFAARGRNLLKSAT